MVLPQTQVGSRRGRTCSSFSVNAFVSRTCDIICAEDRVCPFSLILQAMKTEGGEGLVARLSESANFVTPPTLLDCSTNMNCTSLQETPDSCILSL